MSRGTSWDRMWELFHGALGVEGAAREAWLRERCAGDEALRAKVGTLLAAHGRADGYLERRSGWALPAEAPGDAAPGGAPGFDRRYRMGEKIGEGGFSEVYRARQVEPVQRDVAVKVLRAGVGGAGGSARREAGRVLERFEAERQTLATLQHPGIATIFDAGIGPDGRPYFVMEHIAGATITRYCEANGLGQRERIELFIETCAAVQHAHHKGVIHRDLKPSNVLVTEVDGVPRVKVIDFGIATMVDGAEGSADVGRSGSRLHGGTPGYMSPEQAGAGSTDTRTDVFSLGVVLYELLTGAAPFAVPSAGISEMMERARAQESADPVAPSMRVQALQGLAGARRLRGELDWIVMKALARDRTGRYASAADLGADLRRYLERRPVAAGPATARYRTAKFVARHRFGVGVGVAAVLVMAGGVVALAVTARTQARLKTEAVKAQELAVRDARLSEQAALFLRQEVIATAAARPAAAAAMLEILQSAEGRIGERFKEDPLAEAALRRTIGDVYASLKQNDRAVANAERAVELLTRHLGEDDRHTFQAINNLGVAYRQAGRPADAVPLYEKGRAFWRRVNGPEARETLAQGINLGTVLTELGRYLEAEPVLRESYATAQRVYRSDDSLPSLAGFFLASALQGLERWEEAEALLRATYQQQQPLGEEHVRTLMTKGRLATVLSESGRPAEAEPLFRGTLEANVRRVGPEHLDTMVVQAGLARCLMHQGRFEEAEPLLKRSLERHQTDLGRDHPRSLGLLNSTGDLYRSWKGAAEAEAWFALAADGARGRLAESNAARGVYLLEHGACLAELGRLPEAEERLVEALAIVETAMGPEHRRTREALEGLAALCDRLERPDEARGYRARLRQTP